MFHVKHTGWQNAGVKHHAITVLGHDRPGIIAEVTAILADLGLNLTDSTMTLLRGHFSMMLVTAGEPDQGRIAAALEPLTSSGDLFVAVLEVPEETAADVDATPCILTVHGGDRPGIVSGIIGEVAAERGNVTDLTTRLSGDLYLLIAEVDVPTGSVETLAEALAAAADRLGVNATLTPAVTDEL